MVENSKAGANRSFSRTKWIPGQAHSGREVLHRGVGLEGIGDMGKIGIGERIDESVELTLGLGGIAHEFIAETKIHSQTAGCVPIILDVGSHAGVAKISLRIIVANRRTFKEKNAVLEESLEANDVGKAAKK